VEILLDHSPAWQDPEVQLDDDRVLVLECSCCARRVRNQKLLAAGKILGTVGWESYALRMSDTEKSPGFAQIRSALRIFDNKRLSFGTPIIFFHISPASEAQRRLLSTASGLVETPC
jgi:hypothetical protein